LSPKKTAPVRPPAPAPTRENRADAATTARAQAIAQLLDGKQAEGVVILDVSKALAITDYFVVGTVRNTRQAHAIARDVDALVKAETGRRRRNPGALDAEESAWILLDYHDIVVHLLQAEARTFYDLETMWADAPRLAFTPAPKGTAEELAQPKRSDRSRFRILPDEDAKG